MMSKNAKILSHCFFILAAMIFIMIGLGAVTRLTKSGLSIVEWNLLSGTLPPLNLQDWEKLFSLYQKSPEYQKINFGMSLEDFKNIFWLEYIHRLWGRIMGLFTLYPLLLTALRLKRHFLKVLLVFTLGGIQGAIGWYMVKSGLISDPMVSPYRLALHLMFGFMTFGFCLWFGLVTKYPAAPPIDFKHQRFLIGLLGLCMVTVIYGGIVAGHKAGLIYNTFPKMGGAWIPAEIFDLTPLWKNFIENHATIQLTHRFLAYSLFLGIWYWGLKEYKRTNSGNFKKCIVGVMSAVTLQLCLGVATLLNNVPTGLATCHQLGGLITFAMLLIALFYGRTSTQQSLDAGEHLTFQELQESPASGG